MADANARLCSAAPEMRDALTSFVTETRAYQSPECEECAIVGPLLREADAALLKAGGATEVPSVRSERDELLAEFKAYFLSHPDSCARNRGIARAECVLRKYGAIS